MLRDHYDLADVSLEFLPLGQDSNAGVYRAVSTHGTPFLLKVRAVALYEPTYYVPRFLQEQGIASVVAPLPTRTKMVWVQVDEWTLCLYPFIDANTSWDPPMTATEWEATGTVLRAIHQIQLPQGGFPALRTETFDPAEYRRWIELLERNHIRAAGGSAMEEELRQIWRTHQTAIHAWMESMEALAQELRMQAGPYVICHADIHPGNLMRDRAGHVYVIDWDDVMLAPKERDFLFVPDSPVDDSNSLSPFFQGYGPTPIDWRALMYYRWERVIQDLIEYARDVYLRDSLGEIDRAESVQRFREILMGGGMVQAAQGAATHLALESGIGDNDES
jgi:spectinomycin phosphotransferase